MRRGLLVNKARAGQPGKLTRMAGLLLVRLTSVWPRISAAAAAVGREWRRWEEAAPWPFLVVPGAPSGPAHGREAAASRWERRAAEGSLPAWPALCSPRPRADAHMQMARIPLFLGPDRGPGARDHPVSGLAPHWPTGPLPRTRAGDSTVLTGACPLETGHGHSHGHGSQLAWRSSRRPSSYSFWFHLKEERSGRVPGARQVMRACALGTPASRPGGLSCLRA